MLCGFVKALKKLQAEREKAAKLAAAKANMLAFSLGYLPDGRECAYHVYVIGNKNNYTINIVNDKEIVVLNITNKKEIEIANIIDELEEKLPRTGF